MPHETVTLRTCDLIGAALDWAVAKAVGVELCLIGSHPHAMDGELIIGHYKPSTDWSQGGPLLYQHRISSIAPGTASGVWWGQMPGSSVLYSTKGPDPLVAGLRRLVSEHLGDSVDVPAELVGGGV